MAGTVTSMQEIGGSLHPIKAWVEGVDFDPQARAQVARIANLPFIFHHVAVMPDAHVGIGATVGCVIATKGAIVVSAVGVDIGCGMVAQQTTLRAEQLPHDLSPIRSAIERVVPVGFAMHQRVPDDVLAAWEHLEPRFRDIADSYPRVDNGKALQQLGTMGGGNHFCEVSLDEQGYVWVVLHSGSRGIGNRIGTFFIELAKRDLARAGITLADRDLAYLREGTRYFADYLAAAEWAQEYAWTNRELMLRHIIEALREHLPPVTLTGQTVHCHHNYVARELHFGEQVLVTRKDAVRAGDGDLGIIPGSMGAKTYIVRGRGNPESFMSCAHGAGRRLGRKQAMRALTLRDLIEQTQGVECRKDRGVLDEAPAAYKDVDAVMAAQSDLVEPVHTLRQVVCVKG